MRIHSQKRRAVTGRLIRFAACGAAVVLGLRGTGHAQLLQRAHESQLRPSVDVVLVSPSLAAWPHTGAYPLAQGPRGERSSASVGRIVAELAAGVVGAWAGGYVGYRVAEAAADDYTVKGDAGYSPAGNVGFTVGSALGSATAVYVVGSIGPARGSPWATVAGASIPTLLLLLGINDPYMPVFGVVLVAPLQSVGSTLGFNMTRR